MLTADDLCSGDDVFFSATGVTDGDVLQGVRYRGSGATTESLVMRSRSGTVRRVHARQTARSCARSPASATADSSRLGVEDPVIAVAGRNGLHRRAALQAAARGGQEVRALARARSAPGT